MSVYECAYCGGFHDAGYINRAPERCPKKERDTLWSRLADLEHRVTLLESGARPSAGEPQ